MMSWLREKNFFTHPLLTLVEHHNDLEVPAKRYVKIIVSFLVTKNYEYKNFYDSFIEINYHIQEQSSCREHSHNFQG